MAGAGDILVGADSTRGERVESFDDSGLTSRGAICQPKIRPVHMVSSGNNRARTNRPLIGTGSFRPFKILNRCAPFNSFKT